MEFFQCCLLLFSIPVTVAGEQPFCNVRLIFQGGLAEQMLPHFISAARDCSLKYRAMTHRPKTQTSRITLCTAQTTSVAVLHSCNLQHSEAKKKPTYLQANILAFFNPLSCKRDVRHDCNNLKLVLSALKSSRVGTFGLQL